MPAGTNYLKLDQNMLLDDYYSCLHGAHRSMGNAFELRAADGFTQDDLATMLCVDKALVSRRLNGLENMTLRVMSYMGTAMKCRVLVAFEPYENIGIKNYFTPTPGAGSTVSFRYGAGEGVSTSTSIRVYDKVSGL